MNDGSTLLSFITFNSVSNSFSVSTTDIGLAGDYIVKISGILNHDTGSISITPILWTITLENPCLAMIITTSNILD